MLLSCLVVLSLCFAGTVAAQDGQTALTTRAGLQDELTRLQSDPKQQAAAALIKARLDNGDFQPGDRIVVRVDSEPQLTDTFTVSDNLDLTLPQVGSIPLRGVLRSELTDKVKTHLSQYLKNPAVEVHPLMRLLIEGQVNKPGFYAIEPGQPLTDAITAAGGFTQVAKVKDVRVERGQTKIWAGQPLQEAMGRGYSLDRLNLRAGDRVFVPGHADSARTLQIMSLLIGLPLTVLALTKAF
jgi:protein involved in polysaccharide export with SLBB domain